MNINCCSSANSMHLTKETAIKCFLQTWRPRRMGIFFDISRQEKWVYSDIAIVATIFTRSINNFPENLECTVIISQSLLLMNIFNYWYIVYFLSYIFKEIDVITCCLSCRYVVWQPIPRITGITCFSAWPQYNERSELDWFY